jgi:hypothetical protein
VAWAKVASTGEDLADMLRVAMPVISWKFIAKCGVDPKPFLTTILFGAYLLQFLFDFVYKIFSRGNISQLEMVCWKTC